MPQPLWGRSIVGMYREQWDKLRRPCYRAAGYRCEICGGKGPQHPVEAHEVWQYEDDGARGVQTLIRLIALCPDCHAVKHMGRSSAMHPPHEVHRLLMHRARVNGLGGLPDRELETAWQRHFGDAMDEWARRSELAWSQDLTPVPGRVTP